MRKVESRQQGLPAKKAKLDEVLAAHYKADLVTWYEKNTNIIRWLSFSFSDENKNNGFRSASSIHHKKVLVLVLRCKVLVLVLKEF